jgi:hypothetical protein
MAATITKLRGPDVNGGAFEAIYEVQLDTSHAANGEAIDLTDDFSYLYSASCEAVEAVTDAAYQFTVKIPGNGVAVTSSNVLILAHQVATGDGVAFDEANAVDLSAVGELRLIVKGKKAIPTSWA